MLVFFSNLGAAYNLSFSGQEILHDKVIGLDGPKRKVLVVEENEKKYDFFIIDLCEVTSCKVKKIYTEINSSDNKENSIQDYLNSIVLEFNFKDEKTPIALSFYKIEKHSVYELPELEIKTKHWERMLSKMLPNKEYNSA